jgi:hypothetical protein
LPSEIDPFSVTSDEEAADCRFLATSSTLLCPLPTERESYNVNLPGVVEEVHLPAGGIVTLDDGACVDGRALGDAERHVYFHRSRVYVNGTKMASNADLGATLIPGDRVTVDVAANHFVATPATWVALKLRAKTTERGVDVACALRMEVALAPEVSGLTLEDDAFDVGGDACGGSDALFFFFSLSLSH